MRTGVDESGRRNRRLVDADDDFKRCSASCSRRLLSVATDMELPPVVVDALVGVCPAVVPATLGAGEPSM